MRLAIASFVGLIGLACAQAEGQPSTPAATGSGASGPIVIELFTSQGCSSCPPADRLLTKIAKAGEHASKPVVPLSFHVDYWNGLGWTDPFSSPAWTKRQNQYAHALKESRVYTPELVVVGAVGMVGSHAQAVTAAIEKAPRPALLPASASWKSGALEVTAKAPADAEVLVAVWEDHRSVAVPRGENAGETLGNSHVVRRLERVAGPGQANTIQVKLDPAWRTVGAVVFAQRADKRIVASALLPRS